MSQANLPDHAGLVEIIDGTAHIENLFNQIIENYCEPRSDRHSFFWLVLLDSSVVSLGGKVRVVSAIADEVKFKVGTDSLLRILSLRNAFAHHETNSHPLLVVGRTPDQSSAHYQLHILSSKGKVTRKKREDALQEFRNEYQKAKSKLAELVRIVKKQSAYDAT